MTLFDVFYYNFWAWSAYFYGKIYHRIWYKNKDHVPKTGKLCVISNHQSFLDPPLIAAGTRRYLSFMARDTLFKGLFGWHISHLNAFPISHDKSPLAGIKETLKRLKDDQAVLIFPEGTRTEDGNLCEFHKGIISVARRSKAPILPCVIKGAYKAWPRHSKFPKPYKVTVTFGDLIPAEEVQAMDEDALLERLRETISKMLEE
ncbi:MAG: 1-acyl-sn-glycerol-3-phosphate acyltransferase [Thermoguttaceae bacterium]|nr:1-acyl-sn-glycerol-3-phosphate acyltransferase [Thermoguttaceae bacterium]